MDNFPLNPATRWTGDFWWKSVPLILANYMRFNFQNVRIISGFQIFLVYWSLQTSLLWVVGELAGEGSVDVAVGVSER